MSSLLKMSSFWDLNFGFQCSVYIFSGRWQNPQKTYKNQKKRFKISIIFSHYYSDYSAIHVHGLRFSGVPGLCKHSPDVPTMVLTKKGLRPSGFTSSSWNIALFSWAKFLHFSSTSSSTPFSLVAPTSWV